MDRQENINPVIDKKITDYAAANPRYVDYLNSLSKERLVRKLLYEDLKAQEAKQNLDRGFHQLAVSNPALLEAVREIRATQPPEKQEQEIIRLGRAFAISTKTRCNRSVSSGKTSLRPVPKLRSKVSRMAEGLSFSCPFRLFFVGDFQRFF